MQDASPVPAPGPGAGDRPAGHDDGPDHQRRGGEIEQQRLARAVSAVSLAASGIVAVVAVAAIVATSPVVRDGANGELWALGAAFAAVAWSLGIGLWAVATRTPTLERSLASGVSGFLGALGPAALYVLAMPAVDHWMALGWLWIWSFAFAAESVLHSLASGRMSIVAVTWWRDGFTAVVVVASSFAFDRIEVRRTALLLAASMALAWTLATVIRAGFQQHHRAIESARAAAEMAERRRRANWIHDELLSELRLARLRLETTDGGTRQALSELVDIEHRLRIRQLDAELESGGARLAEIVQPFVRMVVGAGCRVDGVPSIDVAGTWIDARAGYELKRFFGVAVPNALLAGATLVVFDVRLDGPRLLVRVRDDAGGFDPGDVQVGRGRERLELELGAERLSTLVDTTGTTFSCEFELDLDR